MKMKNKITYATAYRDWLAALSRIHDAVQHRYPNSADYGYYADTCHGCQWPIRVFSRREQLQTPCKTMDDFKKKYNNYGP